MGAALMTRPKKLLPSHQHHKASGRGCVKICGRTFYTGKFGTPEAQAEYDRIVGLWIAAGRPDHFETATHVNPDAYTITELARDYWNHATEYYVKNGKPTEEQWCIKAALRYLNDNFGSLAVHDFGPLKLQQLQQQMIDDEASALHRNAAWRSVQIEAGGCRPSW